MDAGRKLGFGLAGGVLGGSSTVGDAGCLFKLWVLRDRRRLATNRGSRSKGDFFFFVSRCGCKCLLGLLGVDVRTRLLRNVTSAWRTSIYGKRKWIPCSLNCQRKFNAVNTEMVNTTASSPLMALQTSHCNNSWTFQFQPESSRVTTCHYQTSSWIQQFEYSWIFNCPHCRSMDLGAGSIEKYVSLRWTSRESMV